MTDERGCIRRTRPKNPYRFALALQYYIERWWSVRHSEAEGRSISLGVAEPTDNWTHDEFATFASKMTDTSKKIYGTDLFPGDYYDFGDLVRDYGGDVLSADGKQFLLGTDPTNKQIAQWVTELRTKLNCAAPRAVITAEGQSQQIFPSGLLASTATNAVAVTSTAQQIGNKFKWGVVLGPTGPNGLRGYDSFAALFNVYAHSKNGELAYDLMLTLTSQQAALYAIENDQQVPARLSVWKAPAANKATNIFQRVAEWITSGKSKGPFPMPYNLRYNQLESAYEGAAYSMWYGDVPFETGLQNTQKACQTVMDMPR